MTIIAFIPARSGSVRIPHKNIRDLRGHPLLAYTVRWAIDSGIFSRVMVCSDETHYRKIAESYGSESEWRPYADPLDADIEWLQHVWTYRIRRVDRADYDCCAILRPTSPFRSAESIRAAWRYFQAVANDGGLDSLRAMTTSAPHPYKHWHRVDGTRYVTPWLPTTWQAHNHQSAGFEQSWQQCGALEIAWTKNIDAGNMSGERVVPWFLPEYEDTDINTERDWILAETLIDRGLVRLPDMAAVTA